MPDALSLAFIKIWAPALAQASPYAVAAACARAAKAVDPTGVSVPPAHNGFEAGPLLKGAADPPDGLLRASDPEGVPGAAPGAHVA